MSEIAALVTDIRLDEANSNDRSGVILAKRIAQIAPAMPRFGVTAYDTHVAMGFLDEIFKKKTRRAPRSIYRHTASIVARAAEYDDSRYSSVPSELLALKEKYHINSTDFSTLVSSWRVGDIGRLAFLDWHEAQLVDSTVIAVECKDQLETHEERQLSFVKKGTPVAESAVVANDFAIVSRFTDEGVLTQLFGMPLIFTYADTQQEAVTALIDYLYDCFLTMGEPRQFAAQNNFADVVRFRTFLDRTFANRGDVT